MKFEGDSVMIWSCMTWHEVGYATKIDGRMDGDLYLQILKDELLNTIHVKPAAGLNVQCGRGC